MIQLVFRVLIMVTGKKKYEKQAVQQFVEEQVQKYAVLDRADPNAKALAANTNGTDL